VAHIARLRVDLENVNLAIAICACGFGTGYEDKVHGKRATSGHKSGHQQTGRGDQQELARFVELHAHLSSREPEDKAPKISGLESKRAVPAKVIACPAFGYVLENSIANSKSGPEVNRPADFQSRTKLDSEHSFFCLADLPVAQVRKPAISPGKLLPAANRPRTHR
jgi:hypothetical protein